MSHWVIRKDSLLLWIDIIIVMLLSGTAYKLVYTDLQFLIYLPLIWHLKSLLSLVKRVNGELVFIIAMIILPLLTHFGESPIWYLQFLGQVLAIYSIAASFYYRDIIGTFQTFMTLITTESLILYPLISFTSLATKIPVVVSTHGASYGFLPGFVFSVGASGRNCGMFWEPGIFASMLIAGMIISLYKIRNKDVLSDNDRKREIRRIVLYIIALFTTSSSAGIVLFALFILLLIISGMDLSRLSTTQLFGTGVGMTLFLIALANYNRIIEALGLGNNSYWTRLSSSDEVSGNLRFKYLAENFDALKGNILFGLGIKTTNRVVATGANTSTSIYMIMIFGILGLSFTLIYIFHLFKINLNILAKVVLALMVMIIINKEPHLNNIITWLLLFTIIEMNKSQNSNQRLLNNNQY